MYTGVLLHALVLVFFSLPLFGFLTFLEFASSSGYSSMRALLPDRVEPSGSPSLESSQSSVSIGSFASRACCRMVGSWARAPSSGDFSAASAFRAWVAAVCCTPVPACPGCAAVDGVFGVAEPAAAAAAASVVVTTAAVVSTEAAPSASANASAAASAFAAAPSAASAASVASRSAARLALNSAAAASAAYASDSSAAACAETAVSANACSSERGAK